MKDILDGSINLVLCDLPYGITKNKLDSVIPLDDLWEQYKRVSATRAVIALFGQGMFTAKVMMSNPQMWRYNLVFKKGEMTRGNECMCVMCKEKKRHKARELCAKCYTWAKRNKVTRL